MNFKIKQPDYNNSTVNLACSILKYFEVNTPNPTLSLLDKYLQKKYKNIVVLLIDGMGDEIIKENLSPDGFFNENLKGVYSSVFPSTTVAATTSIDSGLYPNEHSWLGWDCYFEEVDKNVTVFFNTDQNGEQAADYNITQKYIPYRSVIDKIKDAGHDAYYASPFAEPYPQKLDDILNYTKELCDKEGMKYIYAYYPEPDNTMHRHGINSEKSKEVLLEIEQKVKLFSQTLKDTLLIITADHGQINSDGVLITDYKEIMDCLVRMPSIEPRAVNFFVKEGMCEKFASLFKENFADKLLLFTKEEVKKLKLFGTGIDHSHFDSMLGDFLAVAVSDLSIYNKNEEKCICRGVHAGLTEGEMSVPLIVIEKQ